MNLKELTNVKELIDISLEKIGFVIEVLQAELDGGGDGGGESLGEDSDVSDEAVDPLEDCRLAAVHAYDVLAAVLDVTEPHRKRYVASSVARPGNTRGNTSGNTVASVERQTSVPGTDAVLKGGSNGSHAKTSRSLRRPIGR